MSTIIYYQLFPSLPTGNKLQFHGRSSPRSKKEVPLPMTPPVQVERRAGQRFPFVLPVSLRDLAGGMDGLGFTQDLSSRGAFFFTEAELHEGQEIELTLNMPAEITLGESMRVRCRGLVLRVVKPADRAFWAAKVPDSECNSSPEKLTEQMPDEKKTAEKKIGVAVRLKDYAYLADLAQAGSFPRVSALHATPKDDRPLPAESPVRLGLAERD